MDNGNEVPDDVKKGTDAISKEVGDEVEMMEGRGDVTLVKGEMVEDESEVDDYMEEGMVAVAKAASDVVEMMEGRGDLT